ncbi:hypothetical protein L596_027855 [Steinernema carpocapsae]|uniref:Uncharacterized protein n=1 Tax=Steinernema carpocapsae TaxID=34508 RepID=A0A4V5ZXW6_STECR|nr:hypothetical protein L596_027855 [Steinernema carpocapsae]
MFGSISGGASMFSAHFRLLTLFFLFVVCYATVVESTRQYEVVDRSDLLPSLHKRGGARSFAGPRFDSSNFLYPSAKRLSGLTPYYYYESQPKRGGGRSFNSFWNSGLDGNKRYFDDYRKRGSYDDYF